MSEIEYSLKYNNLKYYHDAVIAIHTNTRAMTKVNIAITVR